MLIAAEEQPPIVLNVFIGLTFVSLLAIWAAGYYLRNRRIWKQWAGVLV